jgi:hypothetical protein
VRFGDQGTARVSPTMPPPVPTRTASRGTRHRARRVEHGATGRAQEMMPVSIISWNGWAKPSETTSGRILDVSIARSCQAVLGNGCRVGMAGILDQSG